VPAWLRDDGPLPPVTLESAVELHAATAVELLIGLTGLYVLYFAAARLARGRLTRLGVVVVLGGAALVQLMAILAPFGLSGDVYSYVSYGRIFALYGGSPYLQTPSQYPDDPYFPYVYWKHVPSFYGPLWTLISGQLALVAGEDVGLAVALFRLVEAASALIAAAVVLLLLRRVDPDRALVGAVFLGWCPFVVIESGLGAHNDALMGLLIVVGLALAWPGRARPAIGAVAAIVLAGLVKLTALALLPLLGLYVLRSEPAWRERAIFVLGSAAATVVIASAVVLPVWAGPSTFVVGTLGSGADRYVNSLAEAALGELRARFGASRDELEIPLQFSGWWVGVHTPTRLLATRDGDDVLTTLPAWSDLLVVGPQRDGRLRVFDPISRQVGFVDAWTVGPIDPPPGRMDDPEIAQRYLGPVGTPDLLAANRLIRLVGWIAFLFAFLVAVAFGTHAPGALVVAWIGLCLVLDYATLTWFWPWYALWALMPAALVPRTRIARLIVYLGWGVMLAYALLGFEDTRFWFLHNYRAIPMFGLPLLLFGADELLRAGLRRARVKEDWSRWSSGTRWTLWAGWRGWPDRSRWPGRPGWSRWPGWSRPPGSPHSIRWPRLTRRPASREAMRRARAGRTGRDRPRPATADQDDGGLTPARLESPRQ
jgi:hypothetical protein